MTASTKTISRGNPRSLSKTLTIIGKTTRNKKERKKGGNLIPIKNL